MSIGSSIIRVKKTKSTMDLAREIAENGVRHGSIVIAEEQTGGRGRGNRDWVSPKGGLWFSVILNDEHSTKNTQLLLLTFALAVSNTIERYGATASIKWPNDVYIKNKKIAGILAETIFEGGKPKYTVIGVGINVNNDIPKELENTAISLKQVTEKTVSLEEFLGELLSEIDKYYYKLENNTSEVINEIKNKMNLIGKQITITTITSKTITGKCTSINEKGALVIETPKKELIEVNIQETVKVKIN